jgi:rhodanese-related sulfurtransferase
MKAEELAKKIASGMAPAIVDVRTAFEFRSGHITGAVHAPIWKILLQLAPLPEDKQAEMVVLCELGPRAVMAKVLLGAFGFRNISLLSGHMAGWRHIGLPLVK